MSTVLAATLVRAPGACGEAEMITALVNAGAAKTDHGEPPLTWASWHLRDNDILKLLLHGEFERSIR